MNRGEVWMAQVVASMGGEHPFLIISGDCFRSLPWVSVAPVTLDIMDAPLLRIDIRRSPECGVMLPSQIMVDQIATLRRSRFKRLLGTLSAEDMIAVDRAILVLLGLADTRSTVEASAHQHAA